MSVAYAIRPGEVLERPVALPTELSPGRYRSVYSTRALASSFGVVSP